MNRCPKVAYSLKNAQKKFPGVLAVDHVDLSVQQGEIHGIIGKNGAGKSVLMTLIAGITRANEGTITINDREIDMRSYTPALAHAQGVMLIPQEPLLLPYMSVVDNMFLNTELKTNTGMLDQNRMKAIVLDIAERMSVKVSPDAPMGSLPLEDQQLLFFGKSLFINKAKIILLDEITASLPKDRKLQLLNLLRETIKENPEISFTLITHYINEVIEFSDRVTILRDGRVVKTLNVPETNAGELADYIVGEKKAETTQQDSSEDQKIIDRTKRPLLKLVDLSKEGYFKNIGFELHEGEVVGLAGLDGSGKYEFMETLTGLTHAEGGKMIFKDQELKITSPTDALKHQIAYLPRKREEQAIIHNRSVEENALISIYDRICNCFNWIDFKKARMVVEDNIKELNVKTPSRQTNIDTLSGGNRQKVIINRVSNTKPSLYLLNEPTRGVDISTKPEILRTVRNRLCQGSGVILTIESEEELIAVSDVIYVFYKGEIRKEFHRGDSDFCFTEVYKAVQGVNLS